MENLLNATNVISTAIKSYNKSSSMNEVILQNNSWSASGFHFPRMKINTETSNF